MLTNKLRRVAGCVVVLMICAASIAPPAHAFTAESEIVAPVTVANRGGGFSLGSIADWLEALWRPLASFWAMDGAKIMEGG